MARISTYVTDQNIVADDKWIGSDSQNNFQTKNFTAGDVAEFINTTASESQLFRYKYSNVSPGGAIIRPDESITFTNGGALTVPFSGISQFVLSQYALNQGGLSINVSTWYTNPLLSSDVLITQCDDITQWAIYKWNSSSQKAAENTFYNIGLTYATGNGGLSDDKDYFISLLQYAGNAGDKNAVSAQLTGSDSYIVTHNLNKFASVTVSLGTPTIPLEIVECQTTYINLNQVKLDFTNNFTGVAIFN
jgi:hypothetical protein|tara:strand:+ start:801 stop:1544 length:744 start_codon:yes stop_codon:yes gene_type:complete